MAKAKRLPSGSWRVLLYTGTDENTGKRIYESITADTKSEAELLAAKRKSEIEKGIQKKKCPTTMTVGEAVDLYIQKKEEKLSPKTIREYRKMRNNYCPRLFDIKLSQLSSEKIQREIDRESRRLSPKTIRNLWGLIRPSLSAVMPETVYRVDLPEKIQIEMHIPTQDQLYQLIDAVRGTPMEIPILLGATCGLRRGEIAALDYTSDFDYANNTVSITKSMVYNSAGEWVIKSPKTKNSRRIESVPSWVMDVIREARDAGESPCNPSRISNGFFHVCHRINITGIRFHDLRHYFASLMLALNIPDVYAMRRMGHATNHMLKNVYQHIMDEKDREVTDTINNYFDNFNDGMQHKKQHENHIV